MASLTNTAVFAKKFLVWLAIFFGAVLVLIVLFNVLGMVKEALFPPPPDPALVAFGKIPKLSLDQGAKPSGNITYKIDTVSGDLKELKTKLKVFAIGQQDLKFGNLADANDWARRLEYKVPPADTTNTTATYLNNTDKSKTLNIELNSGNFVVNSDYLNNPEVIAYQEKDEESEKAAAMSFLTKFNQILTTSYPKEKIELIKYRVDGGKLSEAFSLSKTNLEQVNFYHDDLDSVPVVYANYQKPKIRILVAGGVIVAAKASITNLLIYKFSTYPLKSVKDAYAELSGGNAIFNKALDGNVFSIRDVKLAYLDGDVSSLYLQPVYVFVSDNGLEAYVPAVANAWTN